MSLDEMGKSMWLNRTETQIRIGLYYFHFCSLAMGVIHVHLMDLQLSDLCPSILMRATSLSRLPYLSIYSPICSNYLTCWPSKLTLTSHFPLSHTFLS